MESSKSCSCIHKEVHKYPALRIKDLVTVEVCTVALVNGFHYLIRNPYEFLLAAVIIIYNPGCRLCVAINNEPAFPVLILASFQLTLVVVKCYANPVIKGKVRGDVIRRDIDLAVLNILGMNELNLIDEIDLLQKHRTNKSVKVAPCNQSLFHAISVPGNPLIYYASLIAEKLLLQHIKILYILTLFFYYIKNVM